MDTAAAMTAPSYDENADWLAAPVTTYRDAS